MAKIKQAFKLFADTFSELVIRNGKAEDKNQSHYEYTLEQAKIKSYELRRHTF